VSVLGQQLDFIAAPVIGLWLIWPSIVVAAIVGERVITRRLDRR
jgi:hypothetical protein